MEPYDYHDAVSTLEKPERPQEPPLRPRTTRPPESQNSQHPRLPVLTAIMFVIGLAATILGLAIMRSEEQFTWIPRQSTGFLRSYFGYSQAVLVGIIVSLTGAVLAAMAGRRVLPDSLAGLALPIPSLRRDRFAFAAIVLAALCSGFLYWRMSIFYQQLISGPFAGILSLLGAPRGPRSNISLSGYVYTHWDLLFFFAGLVLVGFAVHRLDRPAHASASTPAHASAPAPDDAATASSELDVPPHLGPNLGTSEGSDGQVLSTLPRSQGRLSRRFNVLFDVLACVGLALFAIALNFIDLTRWDFSFVGDEGGFFGAAQHIMKNDISWNFFNLTWVYGAHPTLDSVYQGMVMRVVGDNVIGWRFSEILVTALTTVLVYLLIVSVLGPGRLAAIGGGVFIASSNYLMAFNHIGYNNTHVIFYSTLAVLLLVLAWKKQRAILLYGSGVALGFCLYTFLSAVFMWVIVGLVLVSNFIRRPSRREVAGWGVMLIGMLLVVTPALIATPPDAFLHMAAQNTYADTANQPLLPAVSLGFELSWLSFWVVAVNWHNHYLGGPLLDILSGTLVLVGLLVCIVRINKRLERLALVWFVVGMVLVAVTDFGAEPHVTRLFIVLPAAALLVGIAINKIEGVLRGGLRLPAVVIIALVLVMLAIIPPLNLYQLLVLGPSNPATPISIQQMVVKAVQEHPGYTIVEVGTQPQPNEQTLLVLSWYPWYQGRYRYTSLSELGEPVAEGAQGNLPIYLVDDENKDIVQSVLNKLLKTPYLLVQDTDRAGVPRTSLLIPTSRPASQGESGGGSTLIPGLASEVRVPFHWTAYITEKPVGIFVDKQDNVYVTYPGSDIVRKFRLRR